METKKTTSDRLYNLMDRSQKTDIALIVEQLRQTADREEEFIMQEILPALRRIKRKLAFITSHLPDRLVMQNMPHQLNLFDNEKTTEGNIPENGNEDIQPRRDKARKPTQILRVTMPDNTVVYNEKNGTDTFCKVIERIGLEKVQNLGIIRSGVNLVSAEKLGRHQKEMNNLYIFTNFSTSEKKRILERIAKRLQINGIKVETTDK